MVMEDAMRMERVEVRLDRETWTRLEDVAGSARLRAVERIGSRKVEDVPVSDELIRQFSGAHGPS